MIEFVKLHGAGNDYIAIDGRGVDRDWGALSAAMSRLNFGVGGDGIVLVQPSERAQVRMRVFNPDGSEAEMSGNGIRLFAKFVIDRKIALPGPDGLVVETGGGIRTVWPDIQDGKMVSARVAMGAPVFEPAAIPVSATWQPVVAKLSIIELRLRAVRSWLRACRSVIHTRCHLWTYRCTNSHCSKSARRSRIMLISRIASISRSSTSWIAAT